MSDGCSNVLLSINEFYNDDDGGFRPYVWGGRRYDLFMVPVDKNHDAVVEIPFEGRGFDEYDGHGLCLEAPVGNVPDGYTFHLVTTDPYNPTSVFYTDRNGIVKPAVHVINGHVNRKELYGLNETYEVNHVPNNSRLVLRRSTEDEQEYWWEWMVHSYNGTLYPVFQPWTPPLTEGYYKQLYPVHEVVVEGTWMSVPYGVFDGRLYTLRNDYVPIYNYIELQLPNATSGSVYAEVGSRYQIFANAATDIYLHNWSYDRIDIPMPAYLRAGDLLEVVRYHVWYSEDASWATFTVGIVT